jgi:RNA polymerase sigma factor (sigma-70 family)
VTHPRAADAELVAECLAGRPAARHRMVALHLKTVRQAVGLSWAARTGKVDEADVDDAAQLTFITLFAHDSRVLRAWNGEASLRHYVRRIAERVALRHFEGILKRQGRFQLGLDAPGEDGSSALERLSQQAAEETPADERLEQAGARAELRAALRAELTERGRAVYDALFVDELDPAEAARRLGTTPNNIYQYRNRIVRAARRILAKETPRADEQ